MNDLIRRLSEIRSNYNCMDEAEEPYYRALSEAIQFAQYLPKPCADAISRQTAIDTLADMYCKSDEDGYVWIIRSDAWARIDALPPAQPEIIRCKDCKWCIKLYDSFDGTPYWMCKNWDGETDTDGFCHEAERRGSER